MATIPRISVIPSVGFEGVSIYSNLVFGVIAARTASKSEKLTNVWVIPKRGKTFVTNR